MLLNCDVGEDSWESLGLQGDPTSPSQRNQLWIFIGRTDAEAEALILWPPDAKSWFIGKDTDAGADWRQEEKGTTEDEMVGWHHRLDGHEFDQALGVGDGQGSLVCCSSWGHKELDTTEWLNWTELMAQGSGSQTHVGDKSGDFRSECGKWEEDWGWSTVIPTFRRQANWNWKPFWEWKGVRDTRAMGETQVRYHSRRVLGTPSRRNHLLCCWKRVFAMTCVFSWQNSVSLCPASFCTPRPKLPVTPGVSWLPTFVFQSPWWEECFFFFFGINSRSCRSL